jgi:hypothetical protein
MSKRAHHPWLENPNPSIGERLSSQLGGEADPPQQGIYALPDGSMGHIPPKGSIPHQLSTARNSSNAATRDVQAAHTAGRKPRMPQRSPDDDLMMANGKTRAEDYLDEKAGVYDQ